MTARRAVAALALLIASGSPALAQTVVQEPSRPRLLMPLYVMHVTLHALDVHSTVQAIDKGHREGNPILDDANQAQLIGAKLAASAATVWISEKLWKKNRLAAVLVMAGVNTGMAIVVANNYRVTNDARRR